MEAFRGTLSESYQVENLGSGTKYLWVKADRSLERPGLSQELYVSQVPKTLNMEYAKVKKIPVMDVKASIANAEGRETCEKVSHREAVGTLLCRSPRTCSDIRFVLAALAQCART